MAIQTEVTLQPDYMCCLRVMGKQSRIAEIVFYHLAYPIVIDFEHILRLVVLTFCPQGGVTSRHCSL